MEPITLFVPYIGPSTNKTYAGIHYRVRMQHKAECLLACQIAVQNAGISLICSKVDVRFIPHLGKGDRMRDSSNYSYSGKMIEDALVECGVLHDDTRAYVRDVTYAEPKVDRKAPSGTLVILTPVETP